MINFIINTNHTKIFFEESAHEKTIVFLQKGDFDNIENDFNKLYGFVIEHRNSLITDDTMSFDKTDDERGQVIFRGTVKNGVNGFFILKDMSIKSTNLLDENNEIKKEIDHKVNTCANVLER
jgi:hypothetical protein